MTSPLPGLTIAHAAYEFAPALEARGVPGPHRIARTVEETKAILADTTTLVISGLWRDEYLDLAPKLSFVQSISAGTDQYPKAAFQARGIRLASAQGANEQAVAEHALALMLALSRHIPDAVRNQDRTFWRPMIGDLARREFELAGSTALIVGLGRIGRRVARLLKAFDATVLATRRTPTAEDAALVDEIHPDSSLLDLLPRADWVVLTCPLNPETTGLIDGNALAAMRPTARLVNVSRGKVVVEEALATALKDSRIAAAALDCTVVEPLPATSPLWGLPNVLVTPHTAGETRAYETRVVALLMENVKRLAAGHPLVNGVV